MKKVIMSMLVASSLIFAADTKVELKSVLFDLNKVKNENMKDFLVGIENVMPSAAEVMKNYLEIKTCNEEFYNEMTVDDIKNYYSDSAAYGVLFPLYVLNKDKKGIENNTYLQTINNYRFLNCGEGKYFDKGLKGKK
jgi:hypothetical protein